MMHIATQFSNLLLLFFIVGIPLYGAWKKVPVFEVFVEGAKQGFETSIRIVPYLIAMIVAIGMLRASGFFDLMAQWLSPLLSAIGMPPELLPLAILRPFSGSASNAVLADLSREYGGNSIIAKTAATMIGSTETTFYVIAVYFGSVGIKKTRHAIPVGLLADLAGVMAAVLVCRWVFL